MSDVNVAIFNSEKMTSARLAKGWTIRKLAKKMGTDAGSISRWESGERRPRLGTVRRLSKILDIDQQSLTQAGVTA